MEEKARGKIMTLKEYQKGVGRTRNLDIDEEEEMKNYCLGMASEVGELIGHIKHVVFHKWKINRASAIEEMGDILWYVIALASVLDIEMKEIIEYNTFKLEKRYPKGFRITDSLSREERKPKVP